MSGMSAQFPGFTGKITDPVCIPRLSSASSPPLSILQPVLPKYVPGTVIGEAIPHREDIKWRACRTCPTSSLHGLIAKVLAFPPLWWNVKALPPGQAAAVEDVTMELLPVGSDDLFGLWCFYVEPAPRLR